MEEQSGQSTAVSWIRQRFTAATGFRFLRSARLLTPSREPRYVELLPRRDSSVVRPRVFVVLR
jgi:hypothetical protein